MGYTLGAAARAAGRSKTTIAKAVRSGKLSATRCPNGDYEIDPAELSRVYPVTVNGSGNPVRDETPALASATAGDLEVWRALATEREETIRHLRSLLDRLMLTDGRPWWRRWFR
jgi:hypothetical protein